MKTIFGKIGILAIAGIIVTSANSILSLEAQNRVEPNQVRPVLKFPKLQTGAPTRRAQAASRSSSAISDIKQMREKIMALSPDESLAITTASYPTFWVYLPNSVSGRGEFVLQRSDSFTEIYRTPVMLPSTPGIIGITPPSQMRYALENGKKYLWFFKVYPDLSNTDDYFYVSGAVQKEELKSPTSDYMTYSARGIWQDALTSLANLYRNNPKDAQLRDKWTELLQAVGLSEISQAPILPCCTFEK